MLVKRASDMLLTTLASQRRGRRIVAVKLVLWKLPANFIMAKDMINHKFADTPH